jgi:hypothetical protein
MFAQLSHMAMVSPNWPMLARFYEAVSGLKSSSKTSRKDFLAANSTGKYQMANPSGVWIDITDEA